MKATAHLLLYQYPTWYSYTPLSLKDKISSRLAVDNNAIYG